MKELLDEIKLSKVAYLIEKLEKNNFNNKIKTFKKLEKMRISKKIGLYIIENSTKDFNVDDEFGGINSSLIELCFKDFQEEYVEAINDIFKDLNEKAQDRVLYLLTTRNDEKTLNLYTDLILKYYKDKKNIPIGDLPSRPFVYSFLFPKLFKALKFDNIQNNILILINSYLNSGVVLKEDLRKNKKIVTDHICNLFEKALKYKFKNTYNGLHNLEYKELRYYLEIAINIETYISGRKTKEYLKKLLDKNDNQLKLFILDNYFKKNTKLNKFDFESIAKDKASRYALFELLTVYEKLDLMPKKYLDQKLLAESDFYINFVITSSYLSEPTKLKFYEKYNINGYDYYVFKFDYKYKYNTQTNDYLTNYIINQVGLNQHSDDYIIDKFIGVAGGYDASKDISTVVKLNKNLLISKIDNDEQIEEIVNKLIKENEIKEEKIIETNKKEEKKNKTKKVKQKKEKNKKNKKEFKIINIFKKKERIVKEKIKDNNLPDVLEQKTDNNKKHHPIFTYILLFLFAVYLGLLIYCIMYIYGIGSINDGVHETVLKPVALKDKGNFTEILGTEIFNQTENEYFVLLYDGAKKEKDRYYIYINEYSKRNYRFYFVDLKNQENKFLYGPNDLGFTLYTDRLLKVKDKEYEYYVDGKTNILNEMEIQIDEIIQKEKEENKQALKNQKKDNIKNLVLSITDETEEKNNLKKNKKNKIQTIVFNLMGDKKDVVEYKVLSFIDSNSSKQEDNKLNTQRGLFLTGNKMIK